MMLEHFFSRRGKCLHCLVNPLAEKVKFRKRYMLHFLYTNHAWPWKHTYLNMPTPCSKAEETIFNKPAETTCT